MKRYLLVILFFTVTLFSQAQKVSFLASSQRVVAVGEQFRLTYKLNKQGSNFQPPTMAGFRILSGPNMGNSSSISIVNGQMTKEISQTYTYVLQATKEGKLKISSAKIDVNGKIYSSNSLNIEVVKQGKKSKNSNQTNDGVDSKDLYISIIPNKRTVYLGEPVALTIKVYTRLDLVDLQNAEFPEYKGFYSQDIKTPDQISLQRENVNGVIYNTALLDKVLLYPQRAGKLKISPAKIDAIIRKKVQRRGRRSMMDDFFGGGYKQYRIALTSHPLTINVKELPANKPASYTGAVGSFKIASSVDNTDVKANDAFTYKIKISGSGNIKLIEDPKLDLPHDFDVWEPSISNNISNTSTGSRGSKTYEYVIQPRHPGQFKIPSYKFTYFDTQTRKYKTISTKPFDINVGEGQAMANNTNAIAYSKEDVELIGKDIRYQKIGNLGLSPKKEPFFGTFEYWLSYLSGIILFIIVFLLKRKQIKEASNSVLMKNRKAKKEAIKRMKLANAYLKKNENEQFYEEIIKGIQGYLSDKLNIPFADFTLDKALEELEKRELPEELRTQLKDVIQECEFARFAPSKASKDLSQIYSISINLISEFENKIKK